MKYLMFFLTALSVISAAGQNLTFDNLNANIYTSKSITWNSSNYGNGFGHRIVNSDPGGLTLLNFQGRHNNADWSNILTLTSNGNVGIGTSNPAARLHVYDANILGSNVGDFHLLSRLQGRSYNHFMENTWLLRDTNGSNWPQTRLHNGISIDVSYLTPAVDTRTWWERDPWDNIQSWGNGPQVYMSLVKGKLGIGTTTPDSKLTVAGNIHSREVKVTVNAGADFVFEDNYNLPTLEEVQQFINENGHLPEIASAKDMEENGIHLGEMNIKLLQKIEELTLYAIEQEKKINKQGVVIRNFETRDEKQEAKNKELEERLSKLEQMMDVR